MRVLVADDFEPVRTLAVRMLEKLGNHVVGEAADGQEAVEALEREPHDLLLLDLSMPRMSGHDVVRWVNARPEIRDRLTIVVISASALDERPALAELGVTRVLPKPFRLQQIADVVDGLPGR
nr:response regulator [Nocardioides sp. zg-DK7169]